MWVFSNVSLWFFSPSLPAGFARWRIAHTGSVFFQKFLGGTGQQCADGLFGEICLCGRFQLKTALRVLIGRV